MTDDRSIMAMMIMMMAMMMAVLVVSMLVFGGRMVGLRGYR